MKKWFLLTLVIFTAFMLCCCNNKEEVTASGENILNEAPINKEETAYYNELPEELPSAEFLETKDENTEEISGDVASLGEIPEENQESNTDEILEEQPVFEVPIENRTDPKRYSGVKQNPIVTMEMKNGKKILIELYPQIAPTTVENFISLINKKFYDGLYFYKVMPSYMAMAGDPNGDGTGGPGYRIKGEFSDNGFTQNTLKHDIGVISMYRNDDPDTAGSQFFIVTGEHASSSYDGQYAGFGKVVDGMDVIYEIVNAEVNFSTELLDTVYDKIMSGDEPTNTEIALIQAYQSGQIFDKPVSPPVIKTMTVSTYGVNYLEPETITE